MRKSSTIAAHSPGKVATRSPGSERRWHTCAASKSDGWRAAPQARTGQGVECDPSFRCPSDGGRRYAPISDKCGGVRLNAVDGLARARTEADGGLLVRERDGSPLRAKERLALELSNQILPWSGQ